MTRGGTREGLRTIRTGIGQLLRQRWIKLLVLVAVLVLGVRVGIGFLLSRVVNGIVAEYDLHCAWEDLDLSLLTGRGEIEYLTLRPLDAEGEAPADDVPPLVEIEYAVLDIDLAALLRGDLRIGRAEIDGLDVYVQRDGVGRWNFERHVPQGSAPADALDTDETDTEPSTVDEPTPIDLSPPLAIEALRLQHARVHLADQAVTPPLDERFELNARVSSLFTSERPVVYSVSAAGGEAIDGLFVDGEARWTPHSIHTTCAARVAGLHPEALAPYLAALDLRPAAGTVEAGMQLSLDVEVIGPVQDSVTLHAAVREATVDVDGVEAVALDSLTIDVASLSTTGAAIPAVEARGLRAAASREADGALRVLGLDLLPAASEATVTETATGPLDGALGFLTPGHLPRWASLFGGRDDEAYAWILSTLALREARIEYTDRTLEPAAHLPLLVDLVELRDVIHDPTADPAGIPLVVNVRAPGVADRLTVEGTVQPFAPRRRLDLAVAAEGIQLDSVDSLLREAGVEQAMERGTFTLRLVGEAESDERGRTIGWLEMREVALQDSGDLFGIRNLAARDLLLDPDENLLRFGDVEIAGPRLSFVREASDTVVALGLRMLGFSSTEAETASVEEEAATPAEEPVATTTKANRLRLELARLAWTDSDVSFVDHTRDPPVTLTLDELGFELTGLVLGGNPDDPVPDPAHLMARVVAPGVLEDLTLEGTIHSLPGPLDLEVDLTLAATGMRGAAVAPYLLPLGIEPVLTDGRVATKLRAKVREGPSGLNIDAWLDRATVHDGDQPLATVDAVQVRGVLVGDFGVRVSRILFESPYLTLGRDADGALRLLGLRIGTPPTAAPATAAPVAEPRSTLPSLPELPSFLIAALHLDNARFEWSDATHTPALNLGATVSLDVWDLSTFGTTGRVFTEIVVDEVVGPLFLASKVTLDPGEIAISTEVHAQNLRPGPLAALLPPELEPISPENDLTCEIAAAVRESEESGLVAEFAATNIHWGLAEEAPPWCSVDSFGGAVSLAEAEIGLEGLHMRGVKLDASRDADGTMTVAGVCLGGGGEAVAVPAPEAPAVEEAASTPAAPVWPRVVLRDDVRLEVERFTFRDAGLGEGATPIDATLGFTLTGPRVLVDEDLRELAPLEWNVRGSVVGLVEEWTVAGTLAPFAEEPRFTAALHAAGVRTAGVTEIVPGLGSVLTGEIENGELEGRMESSFFVRRGRPTELGFERPFGGEVHLADLAYRDSPEGRILAGLDEVAVAIKRVDLARGLVRVESIELDTLRGAAWRDEAGVHVGGFVLATAEAAPEPEASTASDPEPTPTPPVIADADGGGSDIRLDRILIDGIDFAWTDDTCDPPVRVPIDVLEAEVRRFSTRALAQGHPVRFDVLVGSSTAEDEVPVFEELTVAGRVAPLPTPAGWVQSRIEGIELARFAGLAQVAGVTVGDGALEASARVRLKGDDGMRVDSSITFSDLDLTEAPGGPIESGLSLPMSLDAALFLLRNPDGEHGFAVGFSLDEDGLGGGDIVLAATQAFTSVVLGALSGMPLRLLGALVPGGEDEEPPAAEVYELAFAPGATGLEAEHFAVLERVARRLEFDRTLVAVLRHELTAADAARAATLANPPSAVCLDLVAGLRERKAVLLRRHADRTREARALFDLGSSDAVEAAGDLRAMERELWEIEQSLDAILGIWRSSSPRQQRKRTRAFCREIGEQRLHDAADEIHARGWTRTRDAIEVRSPRFVIVPADHGGRITIELRER